jgi:hypothetical protein
MSISCITFPCTAHGKSCALLLRAVDARGTVETCGGGGGAARTGDVHRARDTVMDKLPWAMSCGMYIYRLLVA